SNTAENVNLDWPHYGRFIWPHSLLSRLPSCSPAASPRPRRPQPIALGARFDDVGVERHAVDDGDKAWIGDDLPPLAKGEVGGEGDGGPLLTFGEDLKQEL